MSPTRRAAALLAACALLALALGPLVAGPSPRAAVAVVLDARAVAAPPAFGPAPRALARGVPVELMIEVPPGRTGDAPAPTAFAGSGADA